VFELANAAFYRLVGHRNMIGRTVFEALPEIRAQGFIGLLDNARSSGEPHIGTAVPVLLRRAQDGELEQRYVDFVFQPLRSADGAVSRIFVEGTDVTDRKRAEDALRVADRRKDEFLATLAHELRNPLAPIRHAATISKLPRSTEAQKKWAQDVIDRQVDHMARLLDDLLEVSRITRGKLELRKERLVLNDSLAAAVETARPLIEAREHGLVVELPSTPVHIDADPVRFAQIFGNLLTNAAKYTDPGGLIHVRARIVGTDAVISVQDNGIGISPELLPQLFEMFTQATSALDRSEGGLGIGLSLARGLAVMHGGSIEARSAGLGMGSEFEVRLPIAPTPQDGVDADLDPSAHRLGGRPLRVLVADDNRDNSDSSAVLLRMQGHEVRTAYSGREALTAAAEFAPQVALLDIGMPEMNGYEVARHLRATQWGAHMLLVAVTGWGQDDDRRRAEAAGFDHHLAKPIDLATLELLLAAHAGRAQ
jgi:signal transduction histidine kinase